MGSQEKRPQKDADSKSLEEFDKLLQSLIETLLDLGVSVHDLTEDSSNELIHRRINQVVRFYEILDNERHRISAEIPDDVIKYVDEGKNPDLYTREYVELLQKTNQGLRGNLEAIKDFRDILAEDLSALFPELSNQISFITTSN